MNRHLKFLLAEIAGRQVRYLTGAVAFGYWQQSIAAGLFMYYLMITIDQVDQ